MKFFTLAGHLADQDLDADPAAAIAAVRAYDAYLEEVRPRLPADFRLMLETVCIHDAKLLDLWIDVAGARLALTLAAGDVEMREGRLVRLWYEQLSAFWLHDEPGSGVADAGFHDLLNDEIEVLSLGFEHRILFANWIELVVRFGEFRLEVLAADAPISPVGAAT